MKAALMSRSVRNIVIFDWLDFGFCCQLSRLWSGGVLCLPDQLSVSCVRGGFPETLPTKFGFACMVDSGTMFVDKGWLFTARLLRESRCGCRLGARAPA